MAVTISFGRWEVRSGASKHKKLFVGHAKIHLSGVSPQWLIPLIKNTSRSISQLCLKHKMIQNKSHSQSDSGTIKTDCPNEEWVSQ